MSRFCAYSKYSSCHPSSLSWLTPRVIAPTLLHRRKEKRKEKGHDVTTTDDVMSRIRFLILDTRYLQASTEFLLAEGGDASGTHECRRILSGKLNILPHQHRKATRTKRKTGVSTRKTHQ